MYLNLSQITHAGEQLLLAGVLGACIGFERERHERPAGMRTHVLVCVAATLITIVSNASMNSGGRIAAQIVSGVGFLGAGTILRNGNTEVRGLTTAATLWLIAGIGMAVGYDGFYALCATVATALALIILVALGRVERWLSRNRRRQELVLLVDDRAASARTLANILLAVRNVGAETKGMRTDTVCGGEMVTLTLLLTHGATRESIEPAIQGEPAIVYYDWGE